MYSRYEDEKPPVGVIILLVIGVIALPFVIWGASVALAPLFGAGNAYKKTETADYRIANYEYFKDSCNAIVAEDGKITLAQQALDNGRKDKVDSLRIQQLEGNVQALTNVRIGMATQYNSDASKNKTKAKFKDAGLPDYINPTEIGNVTCS